jgi:hypothetical protein
VNARNLRSIISDRSQEPELWWYVLLAPLVFWLVVFPVLWFLGNGFRSLFGKSGSGMPVNAVVSRALIPTFVAAMLLMAVAAILHKTQEHPCFNRDLTMHSVPVSSAVSPYRLFSDEAGSRGYSGSSGDGEKCQVISEYMNINLRCAFCNRCLGGEDYLADGTLAFVT